MDAWFGTPLCPPPQAHATAVSNLLTATREALTGDEQRSAHNAYVTYLAMLLMAATGHRPVRDPFCFRHWIDCESGTCLISDKVVSERHRYRMAWLPPIVCDAISAYDRHLTAVAERLAKRDAPNAWIAQQIARLLAGEAVAIPYLFYLGRDGTESVKPKRLRHALAGLWPFKLNVGRGMLAVGLRERAVPHRFIAALLGHLDTLDHPFGAVGVESPAAVGAVLRPQLAELLAAQGWQVVEGFQAKRPDALRWLARGNRGGHFHEHRLIGPKRRDAVRRKQLKEDLEAVRRLVDQLTDTALFQEIDGKRQLVADQERIALIQDRILAEAKGQARARRQLILFIGELARLRRAGHSLLLPSRVLVLEGEPSPFHADFLDRTRLFRTLRGRFLQWLSDARGRTAVLAEHRARDVRVAEVCLSAALFGGLAEESRLRGLARMLATATPTELGGVDSLELQRAKDERPLWRWFPDALSSVLLVGLRAPPPQEPSAIDNVAAGAALGALLRAMGVSGGRNPWRLLARLSAAGWQERLPPFLAAITTGRTASQPLAPGAWARLMTGKRLAAAPTEPLEREAAASAPPVTFGLASYRRTRADLSDGETDALVDGIHAAVASGMRSEPIGTRARGGARRARLRQSLVAFAKSQPELPSAAGMLLEWGVELERHGTRFKPELAPTTISKYLSVLARPLIEVARARNLLTFSEPDFEELYTRILEYATTPLQRQFLAGRCAEFHAFCVRAWGLEEPDPSVFGGAGVERLVDANLVTPDEYLRSLRLVLGDAPVDRTTIQHAALLVIGYRYGLRVGESLGLAFRDVHYAGNRVACVEVRGNVLGDPKTPAGVRQVPTIGAFAEIERDILERMRLWGEEGLAEDRQAPYFQAFSGTRELINPDWAAQRIHAALRQVTGDPAMRYHHLRRSWAQRVLVSVIGPLDGALPWARYYETLKFAGTDPERLRHLLTGRAELDSACLYALSLAIGHRSVPTTLTNYIHVLDGLPAHEGPPADWSPADRDIAYLLGKQEAAVRKQRSRLGIPASQSVRLLWEVARTRTRHAPDLALRDHPEEEALVVANLTADVPAVLTLEAIDRLLCAAARHFDADYLAWQQALPVELVRDILKRAAKLEQTTGFRLYELARHLRLPGATAPAGPPAPACEGADVESLAETTRLRSILRRLPTADPRSRPIWKAMAEAWATGYAAAGAARGLRFAFQWDLEAFEHGLTLIGLDRAAFRWEGPHQVAPPQGYGALRRPPQAGDADGSVLITLISGTHDLGYPRTLDRLLFLAAVAFPASAGRAPE